MRKVFLIIFTFLISTSFFGQDTIVKSKTRFAVFLGANRFTNSSPSYSYSNEEYTPNFGYQIGGNINIPMSKHFSFQPELVFQRLGSARKNSNKYSNGTETNETTYRSNYLQIPLNFKYLFSSKINLDLGLNLGILINSKSTNINTFTDNNGKSFSKEFVEESNGRNFLYGLNLGLNYNVNKNIYVNLRSTFFVGEFSRISDTFRNSILALNGGYRFN